MTTDVVIDPISWLAPVGLPELDAVAPLRARRDRKYIAPAAVLAPLIEHLDHGTMVLEIASIRWFRYRSVYFDTADLALFLDTAHDRPQRHKVRTRTYLDSALCLLEVKARTRRGLTVKHRRDHPIDAGATLTLPGRDFLRTIPALGALDNELSPTLTTCFRRSTLLLEHSATRVTIDTDLECIDVGGGRAALDDHVLIETKTDGRPCPVDRFLWAHAIRPAKVSKYATGLAAVRPDLPNNRWSRVLRRYFRGPGPAPGPAP